MPEGIWRSYKGWLSGRQAPCVVQQVEERHPLAILYRNACRETYILVAK